MMNKWNYAFIFKANNHYSKLNENPCKTIFIIRIGQ